MAEKLKNASIQGDVAFLKDVVASKKPIEYFKLQYYPRHPDKEDRGNNIFHFAVMNQRVEFCREALEILPFLDVLGLLCQVNYVGKTPLHKDLLSQDHEISGMIEDYYRRCNTMDRELKNAAMQGNEEFLRKVVAADKPIEYFNSVYVPCPTWEEHRGNMLHLAAYYKRVEFIKAAVEILPISEIDIPLWQPSDLLYGESFYNPPNYVANYGVEIVNVIKGTHMSRNSMDEQLKKAAIRGDIKFLKDIASSKPKEYFQSLYGVHVANLDYGDQTDNILHLSTGNNREEFIREAMKMLSKAGISVHSLFCQQDHPKFKSNPLHVAARRGHKKVVMAILDYYYANSILSDHKPKSPNIFRSIFDQQPYS